jgi:phosphoribosylformimino-5-aminoimidazole carboxamide ribotide isomerase
MIKLVPSISVIKGKVIRLMSGDYDKETEYEKSPVDFARMFEEVGLDVIHLVDLEGAIKETPVAFHVLETLCGHTNMKFEFAGGIRTDGDILKLFELGATYISVASVAARDPELFTQWIFSYGREKISLSADSVDNKVVIKGWQKKTDIDLFEHISHFYNLGLKYVKVTDVSRDGTMVGPNFDLYKKLVDTYPNASIIASGGVRSIDDIHKLDEIGIYAVIFGKAFYEGKITLDDLRNFRKA